jgi:hypothetical protein
MSSHVQYTQANASSTQPPRTTSEGKSPTYGQAVLECFFHPGALKLLIIPSLSAFEGSTDLGGTFGCTGQTVPTMNIILQPLTKA